MSGKHLQNQEKAGQKKKHGKILEREWWEKFKKEMIMVGKI